MKKIGIFFAAILSLNLVGFSARAEETILNKIDPAIYEQFSSGDDKVDVGITFQEVDISAIEEAVSAQVEEYRLTLDSTQFSAVEIKAKVVSYAKQAYNAALNAAYAERSAQIVSDLGFDEEHFIVCSKYSATISANRLTEAQVEAAAAHPLVKSLLPQADQAAYWHDPTDTVLPYSTGDPNGDGTVNASDATEVLLLAAAGGAGAEHSVLDLAKNDVNGDGVVDALDASSILVYTADVGAATTRTRFSAYMLELQGTVQRLALSPAISAPNQEVSVLTNYEDTSAYIQECPIEGVNCYDALGGTSDKYFNMGSEYKKQQVLAVYDEAFFETHEIVKINFRENTNSYWHEVTSVKTDENGNITVTIDRMMPDIVESIGGYWSVLVAVNRSENPDRTVNIVTEDVYVPYV